MNKVIRISISAIGMLVAATLHGQDSQTRRIGDETHLRDWMQNMLWHHRYTVEEIMQVTGMTKESVNTTLKRFDISEATYPGRPAKHLLVLPYPGGRHPRIGFLDGAVDPQRETKLSVFAPWDDRSYAVLDIPEAVWSNLGLTYLAHTHVETVWTKQGIALDQQEWQVQDDRSFLMERLLPNGIKFGTQAWPRSDHVAMRMWLVNGTEETLNDLRVQNCVMLKGMAGFDEHTNENKQFTRGYSVASTDEGNRHIITAWHPLHRGWGNTKCPCLHSDPKFPDCEPGQTKQLDGWFSFYEGTDLESELQRIEATGWRNSGKSP